MTNTAKLLVFLGLLVGCGDDALPSPEPDAAVTATNENPVPTECLGDDCPDAGR